MQTTTCPGVCCIAACVVVCCSSWYCCRVMHCHSARIHAGCSHLKNQSAHCMALATRGMAACKLRFVVGSKLIRQVRSGVWPLPPFFKFAARLQVLAVCSSSLHVLVSCNEYDRRAVHLGISHGDDVHEYVHLFLLLSTTRHLRLHLLP